MTTLNVHEARLAVIQLITEVLLDLSDVDEADEEFEDMALAMSDAANVLLEALDLQITEVNDEVISATLATPRVGTPQSS